MRAGGNRGQTGLTASFRQSAPETHASLVGPRGDLWRGWENKTQFGGKGEGGRDGVSSAGGSGSTGGAGVDSAWSCLRAWRARMRARRAASPRYWSLEKELGLRERDFPRGNF